MMPSSSLDMVTSTNKPETHDDNSNEPTPGGPLTSERIKELGIIKMNDYLSTGTRQQFWEEYYVKVVMQVKFFQISILPFGDFGEKNYISNIAGSKRSVLVDPSHSTPDPLLAHFRSTSGPLQVYFQSTWAP